jgi:hypothetical protein
MAEELKEKQEKNENAYTDLTTLNSKGPGERKWYQIAEVRMVMYVVPVAILFLIAAYFLSQIH